MIPLGPFPGIPNDFIRAVNQRLAEFSTLRTPAVSSDAGETYRVRATNSAAQSIANNAATQVVEFDYHVYAEGGMHSTTVNNTRFVARARGWYPITAQVEFAANATGQRGARLLKNGTDQIAYDLRDASAAGTSSVSVSTQVLLNAGEWVELRAFQNSGGALNTVQGDGHTYLAIALQA